MIPGRCARRFGTVRLACRGAGRGHRSSTSLSSRRLGGRVSYMSAWLSKWALASGTLAAALVAIA
jgi:hypothetical protein